MLNSFIPITVYTLLTLFSIFLGQVVFGKDDTSLQEPKKKNLFLEYFYLLDLPTTKRCVCINKMDIFTISLFLKEKAQSNLRHFTAHTICGFLFRIQEVACMLITTIQVNLWCYSFIEENLRVVLQVSKRCHLGLSTFKMPNSRFINLALGVIQVQTGLNPPQMLTWRTGMAPACGVHMSVGYIFC